MLLTPTLQFQSRYDRRFYTYEIGWHPAFIAHEIDQMAQTKEIQVHLTFVYNIMLFSAFRGLSGHIRTAASLIVMRDGRLIACLVLKPAN